MAAEEHADEVPAAAPPAPIAASALGKGSGQGGGISSGARRVLTPPLPGSNAASYPTGSDGMPGDKPGAGVRGRAKAAAEAVLAGSTPGYAELLRDVRP
jgi:hypothetical protein